MMRANEYTLGLALGSAALAAVLLPLPMLGLLSMLFLPTALVLLIWFIASSKASDIPLQHSVVGVMALLLGAVFFLAALFSLVSLLYSDAMAAEGFRPNAYPSSPNSTTAAWFGVVTRFLIAACGLALGLHLWAGWPKQRCVGWSLVVLGMGLLTAMLFLALSSRWPLSA